MVTSAAAPAKTRRPALLLAAVAGLALAATVGASEAALPTVSHTNLTPDQARLVSWGMDLYAAAGLELPSIEVIGFDESEPCRGREGSAHPHPDRTEIRLCVRDVGPVQEWLVLHELAHAWDHHHLAEERRRAFLELRNLAEWREGEWHERGAENAAEIIAWGLMDRPVRPGHIYQNGCAELLAGYVTLTGVQPLHGYTDVC